MGAMEPGVEAPKILVLGNFAEFRRLVGPLADSGGGGGLVEKQTNANQR